MNVDEIEQWAESIGRRNLIIGAGATVGLGILIILPDRSDPLQPAETRLAELAASLDSADYPRPPAVNELIVPIESAIAEVQTKLSDIPATSDTPDYEKRIQAIRAAIAYYQSLLSALQASVQVHSLSAESENSIRGYNEPVPQAQFEEDQDSFSAKINDVQLPDATTTSPEVVSLAQPLLPNTGDIEAGLTNLRSLYDHHFECHSAFRMTTERVESGVMLSEDGNFEAAAESFTAAASSATIDIPSNLRDYSLFNGSPTLDRLSELLDIWHSAIGFLHAYCDSSLSQHARNDAFDEAASEMLEARQLLTGF